MPSEPFTPEEQGARIAEVERLSKEFRARPVVLRFGYRNVSADIDLLIDDVLRDEPANPLGLPLVAPVHKCVIDCYYERGALEPLARMYGNHNRWNPAYLDDFLPLLESAGRGDLIESVCTTIARRARALFFYHRPEREHGGGYRVEQIKDEVLGVYANAIGWMDRTGRAEAAGRLRADRDALRDERFPQLPPASDLRRVDETIFWELIRRSQSPIVAEQVAVLGELLKTFRGADIKRFGSLYARFMKRLYHWNVWALAYAARDGCSDDSFEEFRTWLILQARPKLLQLAVEDPAAAAGSVPRDPELPDGSLLAMIDEACLARCGGTVELPRTDLAKPNGREWSEAAFAETFPQLVRHYAA